MEPGLYYQCDCSTDDRSNRREHPSCDLALANFLSESDLDAVNRSLDSQVALAERANIGLEILNRRVVLA
jgi:hypothetical protein